MAAGAGTSTKGPTGELGAPGSLGFGVAGWQSWAQEGEHVPELAWPMNVLVYERMLTDAQAWSLFLAWAQPLLDYVWWVEPGQADEAWAEEYANDLGLPLGEPSEGETYEPPGPGLYAFHFLSHLWEALLSIVYGHYYFEESGEVGPGSVVDGPVWHLRALAPRPPATIAEFDVAPDGALRAIRQNVAYRERGGVLWAGPVPIPADRLVAYVWQADARNQHVGRSMLRPLYRHWLVKDRLIRVDAINHERAGGVPSVETDERWQGVDLTELQGIASQFRVGEDAGAAFPPGAKLILNRVGGTDVIASVNYHDDSMARVFSAQVRQLAQGGDSANRAVGQTFAGIEDQARRSVARWFSGIFRGVTRDWWRWNVGLDALGRPLPQPALACRPPADPAASPSGGGSPGSPPSQPEADPVPPPGAAAGARPSPRRSRRSGPRAEARLPGRELRRQPYDFEVRAAVDFEAMELAWTGAADAVEAYWRGTVLPDQIAAIADGVVFTKAGAERVRVTRSAMSLLTAPVLGAEELADLMLPAARAGAAGALGEAAVQGAAEALAMPSDEALRAALVDQANAVANQAAHGLSLAAQRRATQLVGGRTPAEVATEVTGYLQGLKHQWTVDQLRGAVQMAINTGRFSVMAAVPDEVPKRYQASELLDQATCAPCVAIDGREWASLEEVMRYYASGGYVDCEGGPRCRGTAVGIYDEA